MARRNQEVAELLDNIARLLTLQGNDDVYRIRAYMNAAHAVDTEPRDVEELHRADRLREIPGIGEGIATKIAEYLDTGQLAYYESLKGGFPLPATDLLDVPSIGPTRARIIHDRLGIRTVAELEQAAREHRLQGLPGIGRKLEERIAREAKRAA
jgi:DNA polymerase (family X)